MTALEACSDELFARARAGSISAKEQHRLDLHIADCSDCRALLLLSRGFDQRVAAQAGDMQVLARMGERVRAARSSEAGGVGAAQGDQPRSPRRRARLGALLLAAALTAGVATAAGVPTTRGVVQRWVAALVAPAGPVPTLPTARTTPPRTPHSAPLLSSAQATAPESASAEQAVTRPEPEVKPDAAPTPSNAKPRAVEGPSAERLFAEANARRKAGDTPGARRLYIELAKRYPGSPEAQVSSTSLGRLLLERSGDAAGALAQFDRLLARPAASLAQPALAEEALFGRATALMRLGRAQEEKAAWNELLSRFPGSVYAERARERLRALK